MAVIWKHLGFIHKVLFMAECLIVGVQMRNAAAAGPWGLPAAVRAAEAPFELVGGGSLLRPPTITNINVSACDCIKCTICIIYCSWAHPPATGSE
jgi:hypothetical protein